MEPTDIYTNYEQIISTALQFTEAVDELTSLAEELGMEVCWRGQADHRWGLTSSLVRQISLSVAPDDKLIEQIEKKTHKEAASWIEKYPGTARQSVDVKMLTYLQHHGIPTRLIDFTSDPLIALFFACEAQEKVDGRVFAVLVPKKSMKTSAPKVSDIKKLKQVDLLMWKPKEGDLDFPRIRAQKGILAIGKLPTSSPRREIHDELLDAKRDVLAEEIREILSIPVQFCKSSEDLKDDSENPNKKSNHPAYCLTFRIHIHKRALKKRLSGKGPYRRIKGLQKGGLSHLVLYPDADGMVKNSVILDQLKRGVILP